MDSVPFDQILSIFLLPRNQFCNLAGCYVVLLDKISARWGVRRKLPVGLFWEARGGREQLPILLFPHLKKETLLGSHKTLLKSYGGRDCRKTLLSGNSKHHLPNHIFNWSLHFACLLVLLLCKARLKKGRSMYKMMEFHRLLVELSVFLVNNDWTNKWLVCKQSRIFYLTQWFPNFRNPTGCCLIYKHQWLWL